MAPEHSDAPMDLTGATPDSASRQHLTPRKPCAGHGVNSESYEEALAFFRAVMPFGETYEVRVPGTAIGYVNDPEAAARYAVELSRTNRQSPNPASGIYVTLNPVDPALAGDRLNATPAPSKTGAGDADIVRRRHLLIDVDPVRAQNEHGREHKGATDAECDAALAVRDAIRAALAGRGWPEPLAVTMSGNGGGLLYRISLLNDDEGTRLVAALLRALRDEFETAAVKIDTSVSNAARITKIPGTVACKGANTPERPWRTATAAINPDADRVKRALLRSVAGEQDEEAGHADIDVHAEPIRQALRTVAIGWRERQKGAKLCFDLDRCPTGDHDKTSPSDTTIFIGTNGRLGFACQHDTCQGKMWKDAKAGLGLGAGAGAGGDGEPNQAQILLQLADSAELFHTLEGKQYATFAVNGHRECWPISSKGFRLWLTRAFYAHHDTPPSSQALQSAINVLESRAQFDGPTLPVFTRVGEHDGRVYLGLANDCWECVEIDANGWRIITNPPIYFRRPRGMAALPPPLTGGSITELRQFLNVEDDAAFTLIVGWLLGAFRPRGPYPVLGLHGEPGAAKSSTARVLRSLVDPNAAGIRSMPRSEDDLIIGAVNGWLPIFDNLSSISEWISDALCRLATGGGYSKRELYTDLDETIIDVMRPMVLTGIGNLAGKPDLMDRSILIDLPIISDEDRVDEDDFWVAFEEVRPRVLGALLDGVSAALRNRDTVTLESKPRMADFAKWVVAAEPALGWERGQFLDAYTANRSRAVRQSLEASPLVPALETLMAEREGSWEGSPSDLLEALAAVTSERVTRQKNWPKAAHVLGTRLRELAGALRKVGYDVQFGKSGDRIITIKSAADDPDDAASESSGVPDRPQDGHSGGVDGGSQTSCPDDPPPKPFGGRLGAAEGFNR